MSCGCVKRCRQKELLCELECVVQVKFNVNRVDNMVIQAIALLDTLDKDINTFVMRVREWYSWHFPELVKICADNYQYARLALFIKEKTSLSQESLPGQALSFSCSLNAICGHPSWPLASFNHLSLLGLSARAECSTSKILLRVWASASASSVDILFDGGDLLLVQALQMIGRRMH